MYYNMYTCIHKAQHSIDIQSHKPNLANLDLDQLGPAYPMAAGTGGSIPCISQWYLLMQRSLTVAFFTTDGKPALPMTGLY